MRINGRSVLACKENIGSEVQRLQQLAEAATDSKREFCTGIATPQTADAIPEIIVAPMGIGDQGSSGRYE